MLSVLALAGSGTVSASTSRTATCSTTWCACVPRSNRSEPCRSRAATSSASVEGTRPE